MTYRAFEMAKEDRTLPFEVADHIHRGLKQLALKALVYRFKRFEAEQLAPMRFPESGNLAEWSLADFAFAARKPDPESLVLLKRNKRK